MTIVIRRGPNDSNDSIIRKFQKRSVLDNVVQEYRDRQYHKSASEKRQELRKERMRKIMRDKRLSKMG